jgi:hypothetical protein
VRAGVWRRETARPQPAPPPTSEIPTFHEYASQWLERRSEGVLGDRALSANSRADCVGRLSNHLLPFFGRRRLDEIDTEMCVAFKAQTMREARKLAADLAAGADVRDANNRRRVPLGPASIKKLLDALTAILDRALTRRALGHRDRDAEVDVRRSQMRDLGVGHEQRRDHPADQDEVARSHAAQQMKQACGLAHQLAWALPLGPGHGSSRHRSANSSAVDVPRLSSSRSSITRDGGATSVPSSSRRAST